VSAQPRPDISVVIPSHDSAPWTERAVESVLSQTHQDFEIVLVDDGSEASAAARLDALATHDAVRIERQPHGGADLARRRGWEAAHGRYVAFLDDDDRYDPRYLAECIAVLDAHPEAGAVYTRFREVASDGRPRRVLPARGYAGRGFAREVRKGSVKTSTLMVRREALSGLSELLETFRSGGNYDLILRLRYQNAFAFIDEPLVEVTNRPGSLSKNLGGRHRARAEILENLLRVYPDMVGSDRRAVKRKIAKYWAKAGELAAGAGRADVARIHFRRSLGARWTGRALGSYLRQLAARATGPGA